MTANFFMHRPCERPLFANHGKQRSRVVQVSDEPPNKRIIRPSEFSHPFDKLHSSEIQVFLHVPERRITQSFDYDFVSFAIVPRHSCDFPQKAPQPFFFERVRLSDFFDGFAISRNSAVDDPDIDRKPIRRIGIVGKPPLP